MQSLTKAGFLAIDEYFKQASTPAEGGEWLSMPEMPTSDELAAPESGAMLTNKETWNDKGSWIPAPRRSSLLIMSVTQRST